MSDEVRLYILSTPAPAFYLSPPVVSKKSSLQLPALRHVWLCHIHLHLSSFVWNLLGCECKDAGLILTQQFLLVSAPVLTPSFYHLQPSHPLTMLVCHQVSSLVTFSSSLYPTLRLGLSLVLADTQLMQSLN